MGLSSVEINSRNLKITVENGIITNIEQGSDDKNLYISPRFVELHCHLRVPGFEEKETLQTGIHSAFAGGYGIICPMPNTKPVCDNIQTLKYILDNSKNPYDILVKPICAITNNLSSSNLVNFKELKNNGAVAFSNDGKPVEDMETLKKALIKAKESGVLIISHSENTKYQPEDERSEWTAVEREINGVREVDGRLHFAHISTKKSVELIRQAKKEGLSITAETAPHYFTFEAPKIRSGRFKMNPPLRTSEDVEAIREGLKDGSIDIIATDHAPHTDFEKLQPYENSPFGITGFETAFSLGMTNLVLNGYLTLEGLIDKLVYNPLKIIDIELYGFNIGEKAEFNIIDTDKKWVIEGAKFKTKSKITPYEGLELTGKVIKTVVGNKIYEL